MCGAAGQRLDVAAAVAQVTTQHRLEPWFENFHRLWVRPPPKKKATLLKYCLHTVECVYLNYAVQ